MRLGTISQPFFFGVAMAISSCWVLRGHAQTYSFAKDIQPMLEQSCLPCHNATRSEGGLILESPQSMKEGGDSGAAIQPGKSVESLLYQTAARLKKPFMPPEANKAKAPALSAAQLEVLRAWIDQGAPGHPRPRDPVAWKPMPSLVKAVGAIAVSDNARFVAASRGNKVSVYDLWAGAKAAEFEAHPDVVGALAFHPTGRILASGSRGEIKLWRLISGPGKDFEGVVEAKKAVSSDGHLSAEIVAGSVSLMRGVKEAKEVVKLIPDSKAAEALAARELEWNGFKFEVAFLEDDLKALEARIAKLSTDLAAVEKERAALAAKRKETEEKLDSATRKRDALMKERDDLEDGFLAATQALEAAMAAKVSAETNANEAAIRLKAATPEGRDALETAVESGRQKAKEAVAEFQKAEAALQAIKDKRESKQKEFADSIKAHGDAAGAVSSALNLDRNARNFSEVLDLSKKEKAACEQSLASAREALRVSEEAKEAAKKGLADARLPEAVGVAFSEDSRLLMTGHIDGTARIWNAHTGMPFEKGQGVLHVEQTVQIGSASQVESPVLNRVGALAFSADGQWLASGAGEPSRSGQLMVWAVADGELVREIPKAHKDAVLALDFSRDGKWLVSGSADRAVRVWETGSWKMFRNLEAHGGQVLSVSLRDDKRRLVSGGADNTVKTWDVMRSDVVATFSNFAKEVGCVKYIGRSDELFVASALPAVRLLRDGGAEIRAKTDGLTGFITASAVSLDGHVQCVGTAGGQIRVLDKQGKGLFDWSE